MLKILLRTGGKIFSKARRYKCDNINQDILLPPIVVRGMKTLDRAKFKKIIKLPILNAAYLNSKQLVPHIKKFGINNLIKIGSLVNVNSASGRVQNIPLNPLLVSSIDDLPVELEILGLNHTHLKWQDVEVNYENWKSDDIFKAVLPFDQQGFSSYSRVGHLLHVNLRDHLIPYKELIGEVLLDKFNGIKCVVNKLQTIDNTFRTFELELLAGDRDYQVKVKENGITYEFDFSQVYWNPRLSTEHERIIKLLKEGDVLYDVFAGVGPFSIPAAKKKVHVLANDLNPSSYQWLEHNVRRNKVTEYVKLCNKDGRDFIKDDCRNDLLSRWSNMNDNANDFEIHVTMNLPAMATQFLNVFCGLLRDYGGPVPKYQYPIVHVYCFAMGDTRVRDLSLAAHKMVEEILGFKLGNNLREIHLVRNVAPGKEMYCVSFQLTDEILFTKNNKY